MAMGTKQALEIESFRAACHTREVGYCSLENRELPKLSRSETERFVFWMDDCVCWIQG